MKKFIKVLVITFFSVLLIGLAIFLYVQFSSIPSYETQKISLKVEYSPKAFERGKKLVTMLCAGCHLNQESGRLSGMKMIEAPPEFGEIFSANITKDKIHGIGNWTDEEIVYLLRTGIKRDGKYAPPYMAKLPTMADEDINAILVFLRSDDNLVKADPTPTIPTKPGFLTKLLCKIAWKPFPYPEKAITMPDSTNTVELGKYLSHNLECFSCHSSDFKTNNFQNPEKSEGYFAGGNKPLDQLGRLKLTPNLTPDKETGIGNWSKEKFLRAVKFGLKDGEPALTYPMQPYVLLTDYEVNAIYDYLQTIPPISNEVKRSFYDD